MGCVMFSLDEMILKRLARKSGFPVRAGRVESNPLTGRVLVTDFEIGNPDHFPAPEFLSLVEVRARVSPGSLLGSTVRVKELEIHLRELTGIRAECGTVNIERFREALEKKEEGASPGGGIRRRVEIGRLLVRIDHVATVDYSAGEIRRRDYPVRFAREFQGVTEWLTVASPVVDHFGAAGLSGESDAIFGTLLPDLLWSRIRAAMGS